jgi:hypothetical protein
MTTNFKQLQHFQKFQIFFKKNIVLNSIIIILFILAFIKITNNSIENLNFINNRFHLLILLIIIFGILKYNQYYGILLFIIFLLFTKRILLQK